MNSDQCNKLYKLNKVANLSQKTSLHISCGGSCLWNFWHYVRGALKSEA